MKLAKLSLAAIMTVGAMSAANAQPLEEAIKGVDFSGMLRYNLNVRTYEGAQSTSTNDFDFLGKFVAPVTDNVKATLAFASSGGDGTNKTGNGIWTGNVDLRKAFFVYNMNQTTVKAGLMPLGTPITDNGFNGNKGTGVLAMQSMGPVTLAGAYFSGVNGFSVDGDTPDFDIDLVNDRDIMAIAAIGSFGAVNAQVWGFKVQDLVDQMLFMQVDGKFAGVSLKGQWINTKLDGNIALSGGVEAIPANKTGDFYGLKAGYKTDKFSVNAGYTQTDKDMPLYSPFAAAADTGIIAGGWRTAYSAASLTADTKGMFMDAGTSFGKVGVQLGYAQFDIGSESVYADSDPKEIWGKVSYKVAKNLTSYLKYADVSSKEGTGSEDGKDFDQSYLRFEAKYTF